MPSTFMMADPALKLKNEKKHINERPTSQHWRPWVLSRCPVLSSTPTPQANSCACCCAGHSRTNLVRGRHDS